MSKYDTSPELLIQRFQGGFKLVKSQNEADSSSLSAQLLNMPCCAYLLNSSSEVQAMNDLALESCGHDSLKGSLGTTMFDICDYYSAKKIIDTHIKTMDQQTLLYNEEDVLLKDGPSFQCLTSLVPWYNEDNKVVGVFGWSIVLGVHSLADSLTALSNFSLTNRSLAPYNQPIKQAISSQAYLSRREKECLHYLLQGLTTKEIARNLELSHRTVEHYIDNIKNKYGVNTKSELIIMLLDK